MHSEHGACVRYICYCKVVQLLLYNNKFEIICKWTVHSVICAMFTLSEQIVYQVRWCPITLSPSEQLLSNLWATPEQLWILCENVSFYPNPGISCQNLINIVEDQSDCKLHSFWLLSVWAGQWFSLDEGRLPKKGFAQFFQLPSTSMWTSINLGPWLAPVCFHACL